MILKIVTPSVLHVKHTKSVSVSSLTSIHLALLCKSDDVKTYGYGKIFEPLLQDLVTLEQQGVFVSLLGTFVKGTLQCVVSDNLAARGKFLGPIFL